MCDKDGVEKESHPRHGWGRLADDPWLEIGASGPEYREILRRIWRRQGGADEMFERLIPESPAPEVKPGR